jgi:hypothetical protein
MERATHRLSGLAREASKHLVALTAAGGIAAVALALFGGVAGANVVALAGVMVGALGLVVAYSERTLLRPRPRAKSRESLQRVCMR